MIGFAETFGAVLATFLFPAFAGLLVIWAASRLVRPNLLAAFAIGLYLWFFSDTIGDSSLLGVSEGLSGGFAQVALWTAFVVGVILLISLDRDLFGDGSSTAGFSLMVPLLVAVAIGIHGFGEGATVGATAATTSSTNLLDAFGGISAGASFVLHKTLEPMMIGAAYWAYAKNNAKNAGQRLKDMAILSVTFALPGIVGGATSYFMIQAYPGIDFTYAFALGLGTSIYAMLRLVRPLYQGRSGRAESIKMAIMIIVGFACLYTAALLHS